jgi:hypothetical protein
MGKVLLIPLLIIFMTIYPLPPRTNPLSIGEQLQDPTQVRKIPADSLLYQNEVCGYQLIFPESWQDYYYVDDENAEEVLIYFYGKSKTGTIIYKDLGCIGLPLFYILSERVLEDGTFDRAIQLGTVKGINYFCVMPTGANWGVLDTVAIKGESPTNKYSIDETELKLAIEDWKQLQQMFQEVDMLSKTFQPISSKNEN